MSSIVPFAIAVLLCASTASGYNFKLQEPVTLPNDVIDDDADKGEGFQSSEENRHAYDDFEIDIDELLRKLEARIDEAIVDEEKDRESGEENRTESPENVPVCPAVDRNIETMKARKRKTRDNDDYLDELLQDSYDLIDQDSKRPELDQLDEKQRDELYRKTLDRLVSLRRMYEKRTSHANNSDRASRTIGLIDEKIESLRSKLERHTEATELPVISEQPAPTPTPVRSYVERKAAMDAAMKEAVDLARRLAQETSSATVARTADGSYERHILGLAVELVNKMTECAIGERDDVQQKCLVGDTSRIREDERDSKPLTSSGFDFVDLDGEDYVGHPSPYSRGRCESCVKYDLERSEDCPQCARNEHVYRGRSKRLNQDPDRGEIYHLEELANQKSKFGAVWHDWNKLYDFRDLESDKFIDLSSNCTEDSLDPNCQRLKYRLSAPNDGDPVPLSFVKDYLIYGRQLAEDMQDRARDLQINEELRPELHTPSMLLYLNHRVAQPAIKLHEESQSVLFGTKVLQEKLATEYNLTPNTFWEFLEHHGFRVSGTKICRARQKRCNGSSKYRTIEGSCNNFNHPSWGQSNSAFVRILPARYADGIHALPVSSSSGKPLPNPRLVSTQLFSRRNVSDQLFTLALVQWGQILAHDFARQAIDQTVEGGIECCYRNGRGQLTKSQQHHSCAPILIPTNDVFYSKHGQSCMNFVRSMTVTREDCSLGSANQLNGVSSFLDLSPVYGPDRATSDSLRELQGGRLRTETRANRVMMPTSPKSGFCDARASYDVCYETGDARTNQNPQLVILHTLLVREHNRIAAELSALNPHWNDEKLFQESRRILIAEYQHITYRHWLPLVLGKQYCAENKIFPEHNQLSDDYDERINPGVINSFTSAAFRFLHSMVEGTINLVTDSYGSASAALRLSDHYFRPQIVEPNKNFESLLLGLVHQTMQRPDSNFHSEIAEYLFRSDKDYGMDLEAIDLQRGRDHGLPGYNAYRELCHLGRANDFHGLINEISLSNIEKLQGIYEHVDDIDLLVGATLENRLAGSLLGPTLQCLIGEQFYRSRVGDKYFYNNANFPHSFTPEQFEEIKKASLATLICDLGDATHQIQLNPFKVSFAKNPMISCFNLPKINLELWKEETQYSE